VSGSGNAGGYEATLFDQLAEVEDKSFWFRGRNRLIVGLVGAVSRPGDRFLEIGCGTGFVLRALARENGLEVVGTELFPEGLEHARRRVPEAELVQLDAREMPYHEEFQLAGAFDVLEHIDDDLGAIEGIHQALRPGGHLFVTVPQHDWLWSAADDQAHHVRRYSRRELVDRVSRAGFEPVRTTSFVSALLPAMMLARWRQRRSSKPYDVVAELYPGKTLNRALEVLLDAEQALIRRGLNLPAGGSLALVARRR
jgi:SAM-dependent methyltransferase